MGVKESIGTRMRRKRVAMGLSVLALLVVLAAGVAFHLTEMSLTPTTVLTARAGESVGAVAMDGSGERVYVTLSDSSSGTLHVLDEAGGAHDQILATANGWLQPVVAPCTGRVFVAQQSPDGQSTRVDTFDARRDIRLATVTLPLAAAGDVAVGGGVVVLGSNGLETCGSAPPTCTLSHSGVAVLDAANGRPRRMLRVSDRPWTVGIDAHAGHLLVASLREVGKTTVTVVAVFDIATGRLVHRQVFSPRATVPTGMAVDTATGRAFVLVQQRPASFALTPGSGYVFVLDTRTGRLIRTVTLAYTPVQVAVDRVTGRVFVTDSGPTRFVQKAAGSGRMGMFLPAGVGFLHMLDARTGASLSTVALGIAPGAIAVDERHGRVFVSHVGGHDGYGSMGTTPIHLPAPVAGPGGVSVVDGTTGQVLRTVAIGSEPMSMALDDRSQRLIIGDAGDPFPPPPPDPWAWIPGPVRSRLPFVAQHAPAGRPIPGKVLVLDTARL